VHIKSLHIIIIIILTTEDVLMLYRFICIDACIDLFSCLNKCFDVDRYLKCHCEVDSCDMCFADSLKQAI